MAMLIGHGCGVGKRGRARLGGCPLSGSVEIRKRGAKRREAVTALPASGSVSRRAHFAGFAPRIGAAEGNLLGSAVVVGPSCDKIAQKIIGRGCGCMSRLLRGFGH